MTVEDLNYDQLAELKQRYLIETSEDGDVDYLTLANADEMVTDDEIYAYYSGYSFSPEDFGESPADVNAPRKITINVYEYRDPAAACEEVAEFIRSGATEGYGTYCNFKVELR